MSEAAYHVTASAVSRYVSQLAHFAQHPALVYYELVQPALNSPGEYLDLLLLREHPLVLSLHLLLVSVVGTMVASTVTKNYSQVDRLWSILPVAYAWIFLVQSLPHLDMRLIGLTGVVTVWGARLTANLARKGGYSARYEDHRWTWLQNHIRHPYGAAGEVAWHAFNLVFISLYQNLLLWALVVPVAMEAWEVRARPRKQLARDNAVHVPWNKLDTGALAASLACIALETVADQQQWVFQTNKYRMLQEAFGRVSRGVMGTSLKPATAAALAGSGSPTIEAKSRVDSNFTPRQDKATAAAAAASVQVDLNQPEYLNKLEAPYNLGFPSTGLFKYSRHPNFFAEITLWFAVHVFAIAAVSTAQSLPIKLNFPYATSGAVALSTDWKTVYVFTRRATQMLALPVVRWSLVGAVNLWALFNGSTYVTEAITEEKYEHYAEYRARTSRWMPFFSGGEVPAARGQQAVMS
ncbi:hypothetical protein H9P43_003098 [Blastocladiella emersonii ATCC 22665]|nr:hypothetical protein H9P43_003098 [Blastocladiella emersonii ATCC 22665]